MNDNINYAEIESRALSKLRWMCNNSSNVPIEGDVIVTINDKQYCVHYIKNIMGEYEIIGHNLL